MTSARRAREAALEHVSARLRPLWCRAYAGDVRAGVRAMCLSCAEWSADAVRACLDRGCPLWRFRLGRRD